MTKMAGQFSGYVTTKSKDTKRIVELESLIKKGYREVEALQKRIRNKRQLSRQMKLNSEARSPPKKQLAELQQQLKEVSR